MGITGGIIGLVGGIFGILAALATLVMGGIGSAVKAQSSGTVVGLGWGGILFSFLVIVFSAVSFAKPKVGGIGTIVSSLFGIVLGGTLVAIFMVLSVVGGILTVVGAKKSVQLPSGEKAGE